MPLVWLVWFGLVQFLWDFLLCFESEHFVMKGINLIFLIFCCPTGLDSLLCYWRFMPLSSSHLEVVCFEHATMKNGPRKAWLLYIYIEKMI